MAHRTLLASGQVTAGLTFFDRLGVGPVGYEGLADAVRNARRVNDELAR